ncbi:uncharacterized protein [Ptychodera flava]|uniref:uncharacterized protein n=1 Tax=Ptychodera flava TaxID=63121 RepID=UPI003969FBD5
MTRIRGAQNDVDSAVGLAITHIVLGLICIALEFTMVENECYLNSLGVPLWTGTLFMTTGAVGYTLKNEQSPKIVRDYFALSIIAIFVSMVTITYGSVAAWADYEDGKTMQGSLGVTLAVVGGIEFCIAIASASVAGSLSAAMRQYAPLRTVTTYETDKGRTIIMVPILSDELPMVRVPDDHQVADVKLIQA